VVNTGTLSLTVDYFGGKLKYLHVGRIWLRVKFTPPGLTPHPL